MTNTGTNFLERIVVPVRLSFPVIAISTFEFARANKVMHDAANRAGKHYTVIGFKESISPRYFTQLIDKVKTEANQLANKPENKHIKDQILSRDGVVVYDQFYHERLRTQPDSAAGLRASLTKLEELGINYVIASKEPMSDEFAYNVTLPAMDDAEIEEILDSAVIPFNERAKKEIFSKEQRKELVSNSRGISYTQLKNIFTLSAYHHHKGQPYLPTILAEKAHVLRDVGLDIMEPLPIEEVGGLENLKHFLQVRKAGWDMGLPVKGILLAGVPGGGKSLSAKAAASIFQTSLIRLDMGRFYTKHLGDTERLFRRALAVIDQISPAVVLIDEIEKMISSGGDGDHEVSKRLLGAFLFWLQERKSQTFVVATANRVSNLPVELMRAGRWDRTFFVDLPNEAERTKIFEIHLNKMKVAPECLDAKALVNLSDGYTGAEIEQAIIDASYLAIADKGQVTQEILIQAIQDVTPTSKVRKEDIDAIRTLKDKGFYPASTNEDIEPEFKNNRRLNID
ncbi:AAA family ATPase [Vibrio parahaemolyticus]|nr:AAA family ATPase [Vibrio parahaemolyticus]EJE4724397.1 AAA family ATPase [Vibrio parahaemolyticus]EJG0009691.1 AAA family ATPase [Vibrio parahaemolyticus]ELA8176524.1 AAA family ATPase [Vibrio alginolyticus]